MVTKLNDKLVSIILNIQNVCLVLSYFAPIGCIGYDIMSFQNFVSKRWVNICLYEEEIVLINILSYFPTTLMRSDFNTTVISSRGSTCNLDIKFEANFEAKILGKKNWL